jgi:hypothetical protein
MAKAMGIHAHKVFKLGKASAKKDKRNLKFATLLRAAPALPASYDFDTTHSGMPTPKQYHFNHTCGSGPLPYLNCKPCRNSMIDPYQPSIGIVRRG